MTAKAKKLEYEKGDPVDTSMRIERCPNGHAIRVRANVKAGQGRFFCSLCSWNDKQVVFGSSPEKVAGQPKTIGTKPGDPRSSGVTVMSHRGIETRQRPNVISR